MRLFIPLLLALSVLAQAQAPCPATPTYSPCEITLQLAPDESAKHPNPYLSVDLWAEVRSPEFKTYRVPAFWNGSRMVIRFSPDEVGEWTFRLTSNLLSADGKIGKFEATKSESSGFIRPANTHHWTYTEQRKPHLWMGDTCYRCAWIGADLFEKILSTRAEQKFTHMRMLVLPWDDDAKAAFPTPDTPNAAYFAELDRRIALMNSIGIIPDLILGGDANKLAAMLPDRARRERYLRYMVARCSAFDVTWQLVQEYEEYENAREFIHELGLKLKELDYVSHPRTTHTLASSSTLIDDGWMDHILYQSSDDALGVIENQIFRVPFVNSEFGYEDSGAGRTHPHHVDSETFRKRLWNATMNGQSPTFGNTGTYGGRKIEPAARYLDSPGAKAMTAWFDFFSTTRFWELEPYFDIDGGRALALPDVEYVVYIEKPGPVEMLVEKHTYQVYWMNPATGEVIKEKKDFKDSIFKGAPPHNNHDWVLHLSRDGRKEGMLRSVKFESRSVPQQVPELNPRNMPFELVTPKSGDTVVAGTDVPFEIRTTKQTAGTRRMTYLIKAEVAAGGQGFRYYGSGLKGTFRIPANICSQRGPTTLTFRIFALNAPGKLYSIDTILQLVKKDGGQ